MDDKENNHERIDHDLFEDISDEEMAELISEAQAETKRKKELGEAHEIPKSRFPKWAFWLIAIAMLVNTFSVFFEVYSIPAVDFLKTSAKLSTNENIKTYKKAVVAISTGDSNGTGFSVSSDGFILTNDHVVEGYKKVTVAFRDNGRYTATVVQSYPSIDLAVLKIDGHDLPFLELAEQVQYEAEEPIQFIGNPLGFHGIANEGTVIDTIKLTDWDEEVIMIKAPVYRGNSGSPILNMEGKVIGIIFATLNHDEHGKVGLFIPIEYYKR